MPRRGRRSGKTWAIVLAAGEGRRLRSLTTTESGVAIPKQFCSLRGGRSLLRDAIRRAGSVVRRRNICAVVACKHRHWWSIELEAEPKDNIIVQPSDRGTAIGILLPLLHILARDPDARIVLLPSDHHVRKEDILAATLQEGLRELEGREETILLLGIAPEHADPEMGYIVPCGALGASVSGVSRFVEKPNALLAQDLVKAGALWNAFIVFARAQTILQVFVQRFSSIVDGMRSLIAQTSCTPYTPHAADELYRRLPHIDFSRQILESIAPVLGVLRAESCGWSDLGTPKRVAETLGQLSRIDNVSDAAPTRQSGFLSLAAQHARLPPDRIIR
jgi:mannose-1-phosphate guanylyltransferase